MQIKKSVLNGHYSISPYLKCSHGCLYCYFNHAGEDSVPKIAKEDISTTLTESLIEINPDQIILIGDNSDAYPPIEEKLKLTREVIKTLIYNDRKFKVCTKSDLVLRDIDLLKTNKELCTVSISLCSSDNSVLSVLEPKAPDLFRRTSAINELLKENINVVVDASPWIPGILNIKKMINILPEDIQITISPLRNSHSSFSNIDEDAILENYIKEIERFSPNKSVIWSVPN